jgi:NSS family neurotransmitter:Na+ symporter
VGSAGASDSNFCDEEPQALKMEKKARSLWGTRFGFYLAAMGSAFGLGNLWRFPYVVVANGGGAFVLLYMLLSLLIGMALLIGELMLGKILRRSSLVAVQKLMLDPQFSAHPLQTSSYVYKILQWVPRVSLLASVLVLSYYAVITGWVLHFVMQIFFSEIRGVLFNPETSLNILKENGFLQILLTSVHLLVTIIIVLKGVQQGIEKWIGNLMPLFVVLLIFLSVQSLSLPTAEAAMRYLLYPDFSKLTASSLIHAIGHICFTLSVGFGTMVTFGSYLTDETHIPGAGFRVSLMDTIISLFAGLLIFPILLSSSASISGPEVLFQTLPKLFVGLHGGLLFGIAFFLCLYLAASAASIGILESVVANLLDRGIFKSRLKATWTAGGIALAFAFIPALSSSSLSRVQYHGRGVLQLLDEVLINVLLPLIALGLCWIFTYFLKDELKKSEFLNDDSPTTLKLFSHWLFIIKWIAPTTIIAALLMAAIWGFD